MAQDARKRQSWRRPRRGEIKTIGYDRFRRLLPLGRLRYGEIQRQMGRRPESGEAKTREDWKAIGNRLSIEIYARLISLSASHLPTKTRRFESERRDGSWRLAAGTIRGRELALSGAGRAKGWRPRSAL